MHAVWFKILTIYNHVYLLSSDGRSIVKVCPTMERDLDEYIY